MDLEGLHATGTYRDRHMQHTCSRNAAWDSHSPSTRTPKISVINRGAGRGLTGRAVPRVERAFGFAATSKPRQNSENGLRSPGGGVREGGRLATVFLELSKLSKVLLPRWVNRDQDVCMCAACLSLNFPDTCYLHIRNGGGDQTGRGLPRVERAFGGAAAALGRPTSSSAPAPGKN